ncbi:MAG TPA: LCP family protein [Candidatus Binatia bacterium]|nr:LCP family protein [Candidatus Binatia bacterium]
MGKHLAPEPERRPHRFAIIPAVILALLVVFCAASGIFAFRVHDRMARNHQDVAHAALSLFVADPLDLFRKDRLYVLLMGIDYNYDAKDLPFSKGARSDTIMVAAMDLVSRSVNVLSVPRDSLVTYPSGRQDRINAAYANGGERLSDQVIGNFLGLPPISQDHYFDRYIVLKINATKELIDAIGGIDVPVEQQMDYDDTWGHLHIHFKPGMTHMNGDQAVSYSRFRHDACSDPCRIKRQQQVLQITIAKLRNDKFNDLAHIGDLIGVVNRNVVTDFSDDEKRSLAMAFSGIDTKSIQMGQVPFVGNRDLGGDIGDVLIPDDPKKVELVAKLLTGPMGPQPTPGPNDIAAIDPASVHVDVQNGSGRQGVGAKLAAALRAKGFVVSSVGNAPSFGYDTTEIHAHSKIFGAGDKVKSALTLPNATVSADTATPVAQVTDVTVIIGRDYAYPATVVKSGTQAASATEK